MNDTLDQIMEVNKMRGPIRAKITQERLFKYGGGSCDYRNHFSFCVAGAVSVIIGNRRRYDLQEFRVVNLAVEIDVGLAENRLNLSLGQLFAPIRQNRAQYARINFSRLLRVE